METTKIALFKGRKIRKALHNNEWWFVVNDVVEALTDSTDPAQYFKRIKQRDEELAKLISQGGVQFVPPLMLEVETAGGWQKRGAQEQRDYEILTAEISKATFGITPSEYKKLKKLERQNLRDHMNDLELIFIMLGERATSEFHRTEDSKGVSKLQKDAKAGGDIAGGA